MARYSVRWMMGACIAVAVATTAPAQEKEYQAKGELKAGLHKIPMTAGEVYVVKITSKGFRVAANINPGYLRQTFAPFDVNRPFEANPPFEAVFVPEQTTTHLITILPALGDLPPGPLNYELKVKHIPLAKTALLERGKS